MEKNFYSAGKLAQQEFMKIASKNMHFMFLLQDAYLAGIKAMQDGENPAYSFMEYYDKICALYELPKP